MISDIHVDAFCPFLLTKSDCYGPYSSEIRGKQLISGIY